MAARPRVRLFCFPHAGGGASAFHSWQTALPALVQVCPIQLPGRETRFSEPPYTELDSLVDAIAQELRPWLDIPYAIFGHSMGALLAFEWARRLQHEGRSMPGWLILSGRRSPDIEDDAGPLHALPNHAFVEELNSRYQGMPREFLQSPELMEVFLPILRADIAVVESYQFKEGEPLNCPMIVSAGIGDVSTTYDQLLAWTRHTRAEFIAQLFPGGHFFPQDPLLRSISANLTKLISERG